MTGRAEPNSDSIAASELLGGSKHVGLAQAQMMLINQTLFAWFTLLTTRACFQEAQVIVEDASKSAMQSASRHHGSQMGIQAIKRHWGNPILKSQQQPAFYSSAVEQPPALASHGCVVFQLPNPTLGRLCVCVLVTHRSFTSSSFSL